MGNKNKKRNRTPPDKSSSDSEKLPSKTTKISVVPGEGENIDDSASESGSESELDNTPDLDDKIASTDGPPEDEVPPTPDVDTNEAVAEENGTSTDDAENIHTDTPAACTDPARPASNEAENDLTELLADTDTTPLTTPEEPTPPAATHNAPDTNGMPAPSTPTLSYASAAKDNSTPPTSTYTGKLTLTVDISSLNFQVNDFLRDLKKAYPRVLSGLRGCGTRGVGQKTLELFFSTAAAKDSLMATGLDTHGTHLAFVPDVASPISVTLFNIPMEMPDTLVDEVMKKYGTVTERFRHKRNFEGMSLFTGLRVYRIQLKSFIPKNISIRGHSVRTLYTGQKEEMEKKRTEREQQQKAATSAIQEEMATFKAKMHEVPLVTGGVRRSFVHPAREVLPKSGVETTCLQVHDAILKAEKEKSFDIKDVSFGNVPDSEYYDERKNVVMGGRQMDICSLMAVVLTNHHHHLPKNRFTSTHSLMGLTALSYWAQFGWAQDVDVAKLDQGVFRGPAVKEWRSWQGYTREDMHAYAEQFVELFTGVQIWLPKCSTLGF